LSVVPVTIAIEPEIVIPAVLVELHAMDIVPSSLFTEVGNVKLAVTLLAVSDPLNAMAILPFASASISAGVGSSTAGSQAAIINSINVIMNMLTTVLRSDFL